MCACYSRPKLVDVNNGSEKNTVMGLKVFLNSILTVLCMGLIQ